jgi:hypothetical protein
MARRADTTRGGRRRGGRRRGGLPPGGGAGGRIPHEPEGPRVPVRAADSEGPAGGRTPQERLGPGPARRAHAPPCGPRGRQPVSCRARCPSRPRRSLPSRVLGIAGGGARAQARSHPIPPTHTSGLGGAASEKPGPRAAATKDRRAGRLARGAYSGVMAPRACAPSRPRVLRSRTASLTVTRHAAAPRRRAAPPSSTVLHPYAACTAPRSRTAHRAPRRADLLRPCEATCTPSRTRTAAPRSHTAPRPHTARRAL